MVTASKKTAVKKAPAKTAPAKKAPAKKAATKKAPATSAAARKSSAAPAAARQIRVRMYNVGFGDAFLVLIPDGRKEQRILFDCGSIEASAAGGAMKGIVKKIIADVTDADGVARIDVVVATHRHKDHVSGFADAAWSSVEVKEVWLPWTEHPTDPDARRIRELQSRLAMGLHASLAAAPAVAAPGQQQQLSVSRDIVANALMLSNDAAMKTLHSGFAGGPLRRFLPTKKDDSRLLETSELDGVKVHVLGPSRDPDVIRDMEPPKGESYLRLRAVSGPTAGAQPAPFASEFVLASSAGAWVFTQSDQADIGSAGDMSELAVAVALDTAVNGTSLMLMLEVAGTFLLFPGDAQWGTWMAVLEDPEWRDLLQRVSFYKIGHHGSHNATPRAFVRDLMPMHCCTMASTLTRAIWPQIPRPQLLTGLLQKKASIARSDQPSQAGRSFKVSGGVIEARVDF